MDTQLVHYYFDANYATGADLYLCSVPSFNFAVTLPSCSHRQLKRDTGEDEGPYLISEVHCFRHLTKQADFDDTGEHLDATQ